MKFNEFQWNPRFRLALRGFKPPGARGGKLHYPGGAAPTVEAEVHEIGERPRRALLGRQKAPGAAAEAFWRSPELEKLRKRAKKALFGMVSVV